MRRKRDDSRGRASHDAKRRQDLARLLEGAGGGVVTPLLLAGPFQRPVNRGQGGPGMDERDAAQGEPVRYEAGKEVAAPLALALGLGLGDRDQARRVCRFACFNSSR